MSFIETLARKYCPVFYFHKDEKFYPVSPDFYLEEACLYDEKAEVVEEKLNQAKLYEYKDKRDYKIHFKNERLVLTGFNGHVPVYCCLKEGLGRFYLIYIIFYRYNGAYKVCCNEYGHHDADIEHITVELNRNFEMLRVYYSAHGYEEGTWKPVSQIEKFGTRPVVYVSKYSHANYHKPGIVFRNLGLTNDKMNKGLFWNPDMILIHREDSLDFDINNSWIYFSGTWSLNGISGVVSQRWFNEVEVVSEEHKYIKPYTNWFHLTWNVIKSIFTGEIKTYISKLEES